MEDSLQNYANQLWIAARYMESITLMVTFSFLGSESARNVPKNIILIMRYIKIKPLNTIHLSL